MLTIEQCPPRTSRVPSCDDAGLEHPPASTQETKPQEPPEASPTASAGSPTQASQPQAVASGTKVVADCPPEVPAAEAVPPAEPEVAPGPGHAEVGIQGVPETATSRSTSTPPGIELPLVGGFTLAPETSLNFSSPEPEMAAETPVEQPTETAVPGHEVFTKSQILAYIDTRARELAATVHAPDLNDDIWRTLASIELGGDRFQEEPLFNDVKVVIRKVIDGVMIPFGSALAIARFLHQVAPQAFTKAVAHYEQIGAVLTTQIQCQNPAVYERTLAFVRTKLVAELAISESADIVKLDSAISLLATARKLTASQMEQKVVLFETIRDPASAIKVLDLARKLSQAALIQLEQLRMRHCPAMPQLNIQGENIAVQVGGGGSAPGTPGRPAVEVTDCGR